MGKHKVSTFERLFNPITAVIALLIAISGIYFQHFHKEFELVVTRSLPLKLETTRIEAEILFHNQGNVSTTLLDSYVTIYQYPEGGNPKPGIKPHSVYEADHPARRVSDPFVKYSFDGYDPSSIIIEPGKQVNKRFIYEINQNAFMDWTVDYKKPFFINATFRYTNIDGDLTSSTIFLTAYKIETYKEDTLIYDRNYPEAKTYKFTNQGNRNLKFDHLYGLIKDSMGNYHNQIHPDSISKIPELGM